MPFTCYAALFFIIRDDGALPDDAEARARKARFASAPRSGAR